VTAVERLEWFALGFIVGAMVIGLGLLYGAGGLFWARL